MFVFLERFVVPDVSVSKLRYNTVMVIVTLRYNTVMVIGFRDHQLDMKWIYLVKLE